MRVLLCEDDDRLARGLGRALARAGYRVSRAAGVAEALALIREQLPDIALVDMTLPDGHGSDVVQRLREHPAVAVIVVTAHGEEHERVIGLREGADDYVVKPFSIAELLARIDAVSRRTRLLRQLDVRPRREHRHGALLLDAESRILRSDDDPELAVSLTQKELELFVLLLDHRDRVVDRDTILDQVWGTVWEGESRTLDTHVATLRAKLGGHAEISTVRGVGYRLEDPR